MGNPVLDVWAARILRWSLVLVMKPLIRSLQIYRTVTIIFHYLINYKNNYTESYKSHHRFKVHMLWETSL